MKQYIQKGKTVENTMDKGTPVHSKFVQYKMRVGVNNGLINLRIMSMQTVIIKLSISIVLLCYTTCITTFLLIELKGKLV